MESAAKGEKSKEGRGERSDAERVRASGGETEEGGEEKRKTRSKASV